MRLSYTKTDPKLILLNSSRSTIFREVNKLVGNTNDKYDAYLAHQCAKDDFLNKRNLDKTSTHKPLKNFIYKGLLSDWTPEQISGRIKELYPNDSIIPVVHLGQISFNFIDMFLKTK